MTATESGFAGLHLRLACRPASLPEARRRLRAWCTERGMRVDRRTDLLLAISEATTNVIRHSGAEEFALDAWVRGTLVIVSVWDCGEGSGHTAGAPGSGLGRTIITGLSESVDFEDGGAGTRVTMRFRRRR